MRTTLKILGVKIDILDLTGAVNRVIEFTKQDSAARPALIVTPNSEMLALASSDQELFNILNSAQLATADGIGVVIAARIMGQQLPERVAGFDLMQQLLANSASGERSFYFLGSKPGVVDQAVNNLQEHYPDLNISGYHHGYLNQENTAEVLQEINQQQPDLLLVGMGAPLQEKFLAANLSRLKVKAAFTVGGSFDVIAGQVNRAPRWMQKAGLEWLYRLLQEPSRLGRMMALPYFVYLVLKNRFIK
ncbi:WecB/TagA/CpsF family glycosyltransferase [Halanaerobium salsuginis]|uniref:N-acetylglucosaminyldiphosphoundecaprenol N-acetyl-beta-D-mannosaminyltransferase n=1 Tax=Halanaerobium salsuginis TaxID=29563 RepID=A0A1I4FNU1_9FIRM|nr:WecB/TagA/CpsF family glycosyltransferase [Halanaerobium salsuginis]SFL19119.1 N-acetylmannosaminyltransferase [Halanaerobium salsuginis]